VSEVPGYHSNEALLAEVERLVAQAPPGRAAIDKLGHTVDDLPIPGVRIGSRGPTVLITANVHGNEVISSELALSLLRDLTAPEPSDAAQALSSRAVVLIAPAINLDSRARACEALVSGRALCRAPRGNARGVDLNRNFPWIADSVDPWHPMGGSRFPWMPWYRGPEPLSEPEARAIARLATRERPRVALNLHSVGRYLLYPWNARSAPPPDLEAFLAMGEAFCASQRGQPYEIKQAQSWYGITGDMDDWLYDRHGVLSMTVELSGFMEAVRARPWLLLTPAWWMNPLHPAPVLANCHEACLVAAREGLDQLEKRDASRQAGRA
jgi:predicted deacylase